MTKNATIFNMFSVRILGAILGTVGFFLLAYRYTIFGTTLIGIGSILIAVGEK
ncbi:MAG: hypothetical protein ABIG89_06005 [Candidatus Woesearchaeota archaeon]